MVTEPLDPFLIKWHLCDSLINRILHLLNIVYTMEQQVYISNNNNKAMYAWGRAHMIIQKIIHAKINKWNKKNNIKLN